MALLARIAWPLRVAHCSRPPLVAGRGPDRDIRSRPREPAREPARAVAVPDPPAVGYAQWTPGAPRRWCWPLFGVALTPPVPPAVADAARATFGQGARYLGDEADLVTPAARAGVAWHEVAVIGRSNVGKSSLLNALLGSRDHSFVPVSRHPGSTTHLDFYAVGPAAPPRLVLVDSPGYGYNRHGRAAEAAWLDMLQRYMRSRRPAVLVRTLVLLDARHGLVGNDAQVLAALDGARVPYTVVLTKADALTDAAMEVQAANMALALSRRGMLTPVMHAVSAHTGDGVPELQAALALAARLHLPPTTPLPVEETPATDVAGPASRPATPWLADDGARHRASSAEAEHRRWEPQRARDSDRNRQAPRHAADGGQRARTRGERPWGADSGTAVGVGRSGSTSVGRGGGGGGLKRLPDGTIDWRRRRG